MTVITFARTATSAEMAAEMDRRGAVIEALERRVAELEAALESNVSPDRMNILPALPTPQGSVRPVFKEE